MNELLVEWEIEIELLPLDFVSLMLLSYIEREQLEGSEFRGLYICSAGLDSLLNCSKALLEKKLLVKVMI